MLIFRAGQAGARAKEMGYISTMVVPLDILPVEVVVHHHRGHLTGEVEVANSKGQAGSREDAAQSVYIIWERQTVRQHHAHCPGLSVLLTLMNWSWIRMKTVHYIVRGGIGGKG